MTKGKIQANITDTKLQELTMQTLVNQTGFPPALQSLLKPSLIQGIIAAEAGRWGINDHLPSIPDAWGRALFVASLPVKGIAEMDFLGWGAAGGVAGGVTLALLTSNPAGWGILVGIGIGIAVIEISYGVAGFFAPNLNSTVGRGQIGQAAWDEAVTAYGQHFINYLDKVMQAIDLKDQMEQKLSEYQLNNISVKYNAMDKQNVKVLENFMIGAVLLTKIAGPAKRMTEGRSGQDALKYGIAAYHGTDMNAINTALGQYGALAFPANTAASGLSSEQRDHLAYVDEVLKK